MYYTVIECISYVFIRNHHCRSLIKMIPLGSYCPIILSLDSQEDIYSIGTKDGKIIIIYSNPANNSLSLEVNSTHYDYLSSLKFLDDKTVFSSSYSEIAIMNI